MENQFEIEIKNFVDAVTFRLIQEKPAKKLSFAQFRAVVLNAIKQAELEVYVANCYNAGVMPEHSLGVCANEFIKLRWPLLLAAGDSMS